MNRIDVAVEAAKVGGAALRDARQSDLKIEEKNSSRTDIVTNADLQSQREIMAVIRRACSRDLIVGEEGSDGDTRSSSRWYVDRLDGTTNYSHGFPFSCTSIAYCDSDGIAVGVVYDLHRNRAKDRREPTAMARLKFRVSNPLAPAEPHGEE